MRVKGQTGACFGKGQGECESEWCWNNTQEVWTFRGPHPLVGEQWYIPGNHVELCCACRSGQLWFQSGTAPVSDYAVTWMGMRATRNIALEKEKWHCGWGESVIFANIMHKFQKIPVILKETPLFSCSAIFGYISNVSKYISNVSKHSRCQ